MFKLIKIEFMVEHPEVIDSYYTSESLTEVYNDNAEMINDLTDASDNSGGCSRRECNRF